MIKQAIQFIRHDLWTIPHKELMPNKAWLLRFLRVLVLSARGFKEDQCPLHASALTLYTLLSIVPVVAMAFGVAKGFGFEETLEQQILEQLPEQEAVLAQVVGFAKSMLDNTKGGLVAGVGIVVLLWAVLKVIGYIEESFNHIWRIKKSRPLARKFSDYLSLMLIGPILMFVSGSVTVFVSSQLNRFGRDSGIPMSDVVSSFALNLLGLVPYASLWLLFSFLYIFIPNTKVDFKSGILAGVVIGTIYHLVQWAYVGLQVGVANYNAIYGSFAALPMFLIWVQLSWFIVLFGAEISYYHQTFSKHTYHPDAFNISFTLKKTIALWMMHLVVKRFAKGEKALSASAIAHTLGLPIRLVEALIEELGESGLLSEIRAGDDRDAVFQPVRDPGAMAIGDVVDALEHRGCNRLPLASSEMLELFSSTLDAFRERIDQAPENKLLKAL